MRLLIACMHLSPSRVEDDQVVALAHEMADRGHKVTLIGGVIEHTDIDPRIEVNRFVESSRFFEWKFSAFMRWQVQMREKARPDAVVSFSPVLAGDMVIPMRGMDTCRQALVQRNVVEKVKHQLSKCLDLLPSRQDRFKLERQTLANTGIRTWLAVTPVAEQEIRDADESNAATLQLIDLPLPTAEQCATPPDLRRQQYARAWGLSEDVPWFVFAFGSTGRPSGFDSMMLAFKMYVDRGGDAVLLLTGRCRYTQLEWIAELGLRDRVVFVGQLEGHAQLYEVADLFISLADQDPGAWGVRLALGLGRPVVTTTACGEAGRVREHGGAVLDTPIVPERLAEVMAQSQRQAGAVGPEQPSEPGIEAQNPTLMLADTLENLLQTP